MIESNIIEWLDLSDSTQNIDVYSKKIIIKFFSFLRILIKNKSFPKTIHIVLNIIFFIQIWTLSIILVPTKEDIILEILDHLKYISLLYEIIKVFDYTKILFILFSIILFELILMAMVSFIDKGNFFLSKLILMINLLNAIIFYYLIGPIVFISLTIFNCENRKHKYLDISCFSNSKYYFFLILSIGILLLYFIIGLLFSFYFFQIGFIKLEQKKGHIKSFCNYELICLISKILLFLFAFLLLKVINNFKYKIFYEIIIFLNCLIISIYIYRNVYYHDNIINNINHIGWYISSWFSFCIMIKTLFEIKLISIIIIIGCLLIIYISIISKKRNQNFIVIEKKNFELKDTLDIEILKDILIKICNKNENKNKILIKIFIAKFEEFIKNNVEMNYYYLKLLNDNNLKKKFKSCDEHKIMSIIYLLYSLYLEKFPYKEEITLYFCYFLINKFNNPAYAMLLCSKLKSETYKGLYYKYVLMEDIKEYLIYKLENNYKRKSIKYAQIGNVILFQLYYDLFKIKIHDAIYNQIEYFNLIKKDNHKNIAENLMKLGENILNSRKDIILIKKKIKELNPLDEESKKDYILYINFVIEDELLANKESKNYSLLDYIYYQENIYSNILFNDLSSVLLIDGHMSNGKILYIPPNFSLLFAFENKQLMNLAIDDILPYSIHSFHKELIESSIKYSNISKIFNKPKDSLLKNKNMEIFNIKLFVKPVPNLCYGLLFYSFLEKINQSKIIIELDKNFKICGFCNLIKFDSLDIENKFLKNNQNIYGCHIGFIIPEILLLLDYNNEEFTFIKKDYELKGSLYPFYNKREIKNKIDTILNIIKSNEKIILLKDEKHRKNIIKEYNELIKALNNQNNNQLKIFYKIKLYSFLEGKYKYYRIYIDILNNNLIQINSQNFSEKSNAYRKEIILSENVVKKKIEKNYITIDEDEKNENKITESKNRIYENNIIDDIYINEFNKIKKDIITEKEFFPIIILKYLCYIFGITIILFMALDFFQNKSSFKRLSIFLNQNNFFNETKITFAVLYIDSVNLKWLSHSLYINNTFCPTTNWSAFFQRGFSENIKTLEIHRKHSHYLENYFKEIVNNNIITYLYIYKYNETLQYNFNIENLFLFLINNIIKILDQFTYFTNASTCKEIPKELGLNEINLKNMIEQSYYFYNLDYDGFTRKEKIKKTNEVFYRFPFSVVFSGFILVFIFFFYIYNILNFYKIEIKFSKYLINFKSSNFDNYIKRLEEINRQFNNDNTKEDEKEENLDFNNTYSKISNTEDIKLSEKKMKIHDDTPKNKINKKKYYKNNKNKLELMALFFFKTNFLFGGKILLLLLFSLTYFIFSFLIRFKNKNNYINFDSKIISIYSTFKDSLDIFLPIKRQLELYENCLINCTTLNKFYYLQLPNASDIQIPRLDNIIMQIVDDPDLRKETRKEINNLFNEDLCKDIANTEKAKIFCRKFWSGVLLKGIMQAITYMGSMIVRVLDELELLNNINSGTTLFSLINDSYFFKYEIFNEYYMHRMFSKIQPMFNKMRKEKLNSIIKKFLKIFIIYLLLSIILIAILYYFIVSYKHKFNSFIKFICIFPKKYIYENKNLYKEIIIFGKNYS